MNVASDFGNAVLTEMGDLINHDLDFKRVLSSEAAGPFPRSQAVKVARYVSRRLRSVASSRLFVATR